jgi:selenocysteine lyase/cysteine desulfurase
VEIDIIKSQDGKILIEDIEKAITPRTKLISISLVQFLSGFRSDIKTISKMCKERGIIFVVDGIQAAGAVSIDLSDIEVDFFAGGTQKWLLGMQGLSYFYISENLQEQLKQKFVGWLSVDDSWNLLNYDLTLKNSAERFQNGTLNALGVAVLDRTLDLFLEFGKEKVEQLILDNTKYFISRLKEIGITPVLNNLPDENLSGIVTFKHPKAEKLFADLEAAKIFAAMRGGMIRFSPHFYNTHNEIDRVIDFLNEWK